MIAMRSHRTAFAVTISALIVLGYLTLRPVPGLNLKWNPNHLVQVDFYGEVLCPDCRHMVKDVLAPMFDTGVADLMKLNYIAYGKVVNKQCQHGPVECMFNRFVLCAQHFHPDQNDWFPYVSCLADDLGNLETHAPACEAERGWKLTAMDVCAIGDTGSTLEKAAAAATRALSPKLTNVPWIVVNGVPIGKDFENLDRYVCIAAAQNRTTTKDATWPAACNDLTNQTRFMRF